MEQIAARVRIANYKTAFYLGQSFAANQPESAQRLFLREIGYNFGADDIVIIVINPVIAALRRQQRLNPYHQAPWQKARLVAKMARYRAGDLFSKSEAEEIEDYFYGPAHQDAEQFLDWFKGKYPATYAKIF